VNAGGTLVAVIDKGITGNDWGYIELEARTSNDGGKTWSQSSIIASPPAREISTDGSNTATSFYIDPCMSVAPNGDIVMIVTFFPESKGFHNRKILENKKVAYTSFDGEICPVIYDRDGKNYIVLSDGTILDSNKIKTEYSVKYPQGELYKGDEYVGNIYLNGAIGKSDVEDGKTTFGAPLKSPKRSYIFMFKSSDKGATWSAPVDITGSILNQEKDGAFFAVAPGSGVTTSTGRIIMPIYTVHGTVAIYSDDNGETWHRNPQVLYSESIDEWTPVEAPNGDIYAFSRAKSYKKTPVAISKDKGISWSKAKSAKFKAPKCQKDAIVIGDKVCVSHPSKKKRENGVISVGRFEFDKKGKMKGIKWDKNSEISINDGFFAYSCMAQINANTIGVLYEDEPGGHIVFETFTI
jgi:hypothetical protein